jgi:nucleotide-binding universal stress UspA family protein
MYRVLLPVDEQTDRAMQGAEAATSLPGAGESLEVVVLNVFEEFEVSGEAPVDSEEVWDETSFPDSAQAVEDHLESAGVSVTMRREHGDPAEQIVEVAEEIDADAIVMSGRSRSPTGKALFGSVTQSVLLSAERPVMVDLSE